VNQSFFSEAILSTLVSSFDAITATNARLDTLIEFASSSLDIQSVTADNTLAAVGRLDDVIHVLEDELSVNITHVSTSNALTVNNNGTFAV